MTQLPQLQFLAATHKQKHQTVKCISLIIWSIWCAADTKFNKHFQAIPSWNRMCILKRGQKADLIRRACATHQHHHCNMIRFQIPNPQRQLWWMLERISSQWFSLRASVCMHLGGWPVCVCSLITCTAVYVTFCMHGRVWGTRAVLTVTFVYHKHRRQML